MNLGEYLSSAERQLKQAGIDSARLDALILLEDSLHKDRAWLLAHPEYDIAGDQVKRLQAKLDRRARRIPLSYIRGHSQFYGRRFKLNRHVLEPRPESETMISLLKALNLPKRPAIADIGTGSGALGITAALEIDGSQVDLYDISASALAVAKHNTHLHELHLHCRKMNLLSRPLQPYDAILANLPYIPDHWQLHPSILEEPRIAFMGGEDGVEVYRKLFAQLRRFAWTPKFVLTESMPPQHKKLAQVAEKAGFSLQKTEDFIQIFTPIKNT
jgi:release factor glutamine methyltransferase